MSCGCKKTKVEDIRITNVSIVEEIIPQPTPEEIKLDLNGKDIKETSTNGDSE